MTDKISTNFTLTLSQSPIYDRLFAYMSPIDLYNLMKCRKKIYQIYMTFPNRLKLYEAINNQKKSKLKKGTYFTTNDVVSIIIQYGDLRLLEWVYEHDQDRKGNIYYKIEIAAEYGHLEIVEWLHNKGIRCTTDAMDYAALNGHLHVIKWLHKNRKEGCTTRAMDWAALSGQLDVIKWLHKNRNAGCTVNAVINATTPCCNNLISYEQIETVKWLYKYRKECRSDYAISNIFNGGRYSRELYAWIKPIYKNMCIRRGYDDY